MKLAILMAAFIIVALVHNDYILSFMLIFAWALTDYLKQEKL